MNKEKKYITIISIVFIIVLLLSISSYLIIKKGITSSNKEEPIIKTEIPKIIEEYETAYLKEISTYTNNIYVDSNSKEIRLLSDEKDIDYYIIGKIGVIYNNPITIYKDDQNVKETYGNYKILNDEESQRYYYINSKSKIVSDLYDLIIPIYFQNNICHYLLLEKDTFNYLLNINTDDLIPLGSEIKYVMINNEEYKIGNDKYLIYENDNEEYGLIDFNGNIIIEANYKELLPYNTSTTFIAKKDNKYGVINYKNETIINFDYDSITYLNDMGKYLILEKDNTIGILYNNKIIVDFKIKYDKNDIFDCITNDDNLYINIISSKNNNTLYKINKKGIEKKQDGSFYGILNNSNELKYFYKINEKNNILELSIYDTDLFEYYTTNVDYKKQYDYELYFTNIDDTDYYRMNIIYDLEDDSEDQILYIDLKNSKIVKEIKALYNYFDNGYGFTINTKYDLSIYKKEELLNTYGNITMYLGGYYFLSENYDNKGNFKSTIYKVEFKKESK